VSVHVCRKRSGLAFFFLRKVIETAGVLTVSFRQSSQNENASRGTAKYFRAMLHCDGGYWLAVANSDVELFGH
jgi:hypothetical protein